MGGFRNWPFLLTNSTHRVVMWVRKPPKTCLRNIWMVPKAIFLISKLIFSPFNFFEIFEVVWKNPVSKHNFIPSSKWIKTHFSSKCHPVAAGPLSDLMKMNVKVLRFTNVYLHRLPFLLASLYQIILDWKWITRFVLVMQLVKKGWYLFLEIPALSKIRK